MAFSDEQRDMIIAEIVTNGLFSEDNQDQLQELTDNQLVALVNPQELDELINNAKKKPVMVEDDDDEDEDMENNMEDYKTKKKKKMVGNSQPSLDEWLSSAPREVQALVANAQRVEEQQRTEYIETITANNSDLSAEELENRSTEDLQLFAKITSNKAAVTTQSSGATFPRFNFSGAAGGATPTTNTRQGVEPLALPGADYMTDK